MKKLLSAIISLFLLSTIPAHATLIEALQTNSPDSEDSSSDISLDDFQGVWVATKVGVGRITVSAGLVDLQMELDIHRNIVYITNSTLELYHEPRLFSLENGKLIRNDIAEDYEIKKNEDGTITLYVISDNVRQSYIVFERSDVGKADDISDVRDVAASVESKPVVLNSKGVFIVAEDAELQDGYTSGGNYLNLNVVVENKTDDTISIRADNCIIGDWDVDAYCNIEVQPHKKKKGDIQIYYQSTDITDLDEIKTIKINFRIVDSDYDSVSVEGYNVKGKWVCNKIKEKYSVYAQPDSSLDFDTLSRNPSIYEGQSFTFSGKVLQVLESSQSDGNVEVNMRIATKDGYDDIVFVIYYRGQYESRILEDDFVTLNGTYLGLTSYESVIGNTITLPLFLADSISIN